MKKLNYKWLYLLLFYPLMFSCNESEVWTDHYEQTEFERTDLRLAEFIQSQDDLSKFSQMLEKSGYDTILNASQSYTVWAPNNDALADVDVTDADKVMEIVRNHIARFTISTSGIEDRRIFMLDKKFINFVNEGSGYSFGNKTVSKADILANNGIIHVIDGYVPYIDNLYEFISNQNELDSVRNYILSQNQLGFDPLSSDVITYNADGEPIYDSVFVVNNVILERIGDINNEDSLFTALLPNNSAWASSFNYIKEFFKVTPADGGANRQLTYTRNQIIDNTIFREKVLDASAFDSLRTSTGNVLHNPANIFDGADYYELSNGWAYVTDTLKYSPTETFLKEIRIEAENPQTRVPQNVNISQRTSGGTGYNLSNSKYIQADPTSTSSRVIPIVQFRLPNTLSAKYRIYCVFVPSSIAGSDTAVSQVGFELHYHDVKSNGSTREVVDAYVEEDMITNANDTTKMLVTEFEFPYSNIIDEEDDETVQKDNQVTLFVANFEKKETVSRTRKMRIDCIILEPVIE